MPLKILLVILFSIVSVHIHATETDTLQHNVDSLQLLLKKYEATKRELRQATPFPGDTLKAEILWQLCQNISYSDKALLSNIVKQLHELSSALNYKRGMAHVLSIEGKILSYNNQFDEAIVLHTRALTLYQQTNDKLGIRASYFDLGANNQWQNKIRAAAPYYTDCLKQSEKDKDTNYIANSLMCLANIYSNLKDNNAAINYNTKAIDIYRRLDNQAMLFYTQNYQCGYLIELEKFKDAEMLIVQMEPLVKILHSDYVNNFYYGSIANLNMRINKYDKAIVYFKKTIEYAVKSDDQLNLSILYSNYAQSIYKATPAQLKKAGISPSHKNSEAKKSLQLAIKTGKENNLIQNIPEAYQYLSLINEDEHNETEALANYKTYTTLKDSVEGSDKSTAINDLKIGYETSKKEQEIEVLKNQQEIEKLKANQRLAITYGLGIALIVLIFLAFVFYRQNINTKIINKDLEKAYKDLESAQSQLIRSEKMAAFGIMASRVSHEIQNPLNFINNFSEIAEEMVNDIVILNSEQERSDTAKDLINNLQKIKIHGLRANSIVKQLQEHTNKGTAHEYFETT